MCFLWRPSHGRNCMPLSASKQLHHLARSNQRADPRFTSLPTSAHPFPHPCTKGTKPRHKVHDCFARTALRCNHVVDNRDAHQHACENGPGIVLWLCEAHAEERCGEEEREGNVLDFISTTVYPSDKGESLVETKMACIQGMSSFLTIRATL
jgi:hypothetical protein